MEPQRLVVIHHRVSPFDEYNHETNGGAAGCWCEPDIAQNTVLDTTVVICTHQILKPAKWKR